MNERSSVSLLSFYHPHMGSNGRKTMIGLAVVGLLLIALLFTVRSSRKPSAPVVSHRFLQSRQELLAKYGQPATSKPSKMFSSGERLSFRSGNLVVDADFFGNECHYLQYTLPQAWTDAQIAAALEKNGTGWQQQPSLTGLMPAPLRFADFTSTEGHRAKYSAPVHWLEIWSCQLVEEAQRQKAEKERKAAEIPKF